MRPTRIRRLGLTSLFWLLLPLAACTDEGGKVPLPEGAGGSTTTPPVEQNAPLQMVGDAAQIPPASASVVLDERLDVDEAYLGAFSSTDAWAQGWSRAAGAAAPASLAAAETLPSSITQDTRLVGGRVYRIAAGGTQVSGGVLSIEAGAVLVAAADDALTITAEAAINVDGHVDAPVLMTNLGDADTGEWGGLTIVDGARSNRLSTLQIRHARVGLSWRGSRADSAADRLEIAASSERALVLDGGAGHLRHLLLTGNADGVLQKGDWRGLMQNVWIAQDGGAAVAAQDDAAGMLANASLVGNGSGNALAFSGHGAGRVLNLLVKGFAGGLSASDPGAFDGALGKARAAVFNAWFDAAGNTLQTSTRYPDWFTLARSNRREALSFNGFLPASGTFEGARYRPDGAGFIDDAVRFVGAFDPAIYDPAQGPTRESDWSYGWTVGLYDYDGDGSPDSDLWKDDLVVADGACPPGTTAFDETTCILPARITENLRLTADKVWALNPDDTIVGFGEDDDPANDIAVDLSIDPGTKVIAGDGVRLVISRGTRMFAEGTASRPIIFTSSRDVAGVDETDGQWGGIMVLGYAPSTLCNSEGCQALAEGSDGDVIHYYGGTRPDDDSGVYRYLVIKHSGKKLSQEGNELNAITFQGVGSRTLVDYVQAYKCIDDGMQFEGSSLVTKHIVLVGNNDDAVDWEHGFTGGMQFVQILHNGAKDIPRAFEVDTSTSDPGALPTSNPVIANVSAVRTPTTDTRQAIWMRFGTAGLFTNSLFNHYGSSCFVVQHPSTAAHLFSDENGDGLNDADPAVYLDLRNTFADCSTYTAQAKSSVDQEPVTQWYFAPGKNNQKLDTHLDATAHPTAESPVLLDSGFRVVQPGRS